MLSLLALAPGVPLPSKATELISSENALQGVTKQVKCAFAMLDQDSSDMVTVSSTGGVPTNPSLEYGCAAAPGVDPRRRRRR